MKELHGDPSKDIAGGLDPRDSETQVAPEPAPADPLVVTDYNPPIQPQ